MTKNNFHYAFVLLEQMHGVEMNALDFEELGLIAWNLIGNKDVRLYRKKLKVDCNDYTVEIPCNAVQIEAITRAGQDYQYTTNRTVYDNQDSNFTESYIESMKFNSDPLYLGGGYVKYHQSGNILHLAGNYGGDVYILYKGVELDEEGLPSITDKEAIAIASYCAFITYHKKGLVTMNKFLIEASRLLEQDWKRQCDAARVPDYLSQNDMNKILDAKSSWNRKIFNKSFKPVK